MSWLCGELPTGTVFDSRNLDFEECYRNLILFGVPFVYLLCCGSYHLLTSWKHPKRQFSQEIRSVEWIVFGFSLVMVVCFWGLNSGHVTTTRDHVAIRHLIRWDYTSRRSSSKKSRNPDQIDNYTHGSVPAFF